MKKSLLILLNLVLVTSPLLIFSQGIGINNPTPAVSSLLDLTSTTKGFLVPRMTNIQRLAIAAPATGLLVYETTSNQFYFFDGTLWRSLLGDDKGWLLSGNIGTVDGVHFLGTSDNVPLNFRVNNLKAGRVDPGNRNVMLGRLAGNTTNPGQTLNTYVGDSAGAQVINGLSNTVIGGGALSLGTSSSNNVVIGADAGKNSGGTSNVIVGALAGRFSSGNANVFIGSLAGDLATAGFNSFIGQFSGRNVTTGRGNTFMGQSTGQSTTSGNNNTIVGWRSGLNNGSGSYNTLLGDSANVFLSTQVNSTAIGSKAQVSSSNSMVLGSIAGINGATANVNVGIGTTIPAASSALDITSSNRGILIPRIALVSTNSTTPVAAPTVSLLVYNTASSGAPPFSVTPGFYYWNGTIWERLTDGSAAADWSVTGNAGTADAINFIGTTDNVPLNFRVSNFKAGKLDFANENAFFGLFTGNSNLPGINQGNKNTFMGSGAGAGNTTGGMNTYVGVNAGGNGGTGSVNAFFGANAGQANSASFNSFFGGLSGSANSNGQFNSFFGETSGTNNTNGSENAFFGQSAGAGNTTGNQNAFFGRRSGFSNNAGGNSFFGYLTGELNTTGSANTFIGGRSGSKNTIGLQNVFAGELSGFSNTQGNFNTFIGQQAGQSNTTASQNTYLGHRSGFINTTGTHNVAVGDSALFSNSASGNTALGSKAGSATTTGNENTYVGRMSGFSNTTGTSNTTLGFRSGDNMTGSQNVVIGADARFGLAASSSGSGNVLIGALAASNTSNVGNSNVIIGKSGGGNPLNIGNFNVIVGENAGTSNASLTQNNTIVGRQARIQSSLGGSAAQDITLLGANSQAEDQPLLGISKITLLGTNTRSIHTTNATAVGADAVVGGSNMLVLGSISGTNGATATVNVGIGTINPSRRLHIANTGFSGGTSHPNSGLVLESNTNTYVQLMAPDANETGLLLSRPGSGPLASILFNTAGVPDGLTFGTLNSVRMTVASNGNVGIGTANPTERLMVVGNIDATDDLYTGATNGIINCGGGNMNALINMIADVTPTPLNVNGDEDLYIADDLELGSQGFKPGGGTWAAASDVRLKKDVHPYTDGLSQILQIKPVRFKYNDHFKSLDTGKEYIGVIAQEIKEVAPYTVELTAFGEQRSEDENGVEHIIKEGELFYSYDSSALTYMLINAVKEQQQLINDLRKEVNELKGLMRK